MTKNRKQMIVLSLAAVAAIAVATLTPTIAQQVGKQAPPTSVGVCNIMQIFSQYQRAKDLTKMLAKKQGAIQAETEKRTKEIEALNTELDSYVAGKAEYNRVKEKIERLSIDLQVWRRIKETSLLREHLRLTKEMYTEVKNAIETVAKQHGITLVLQLEPPSMQARSATEMVNLISRKKILFSDQNLNITPFVLQRLNETYRAHGSN